MPQQMLCGKPFFTQKQQRRPIVNNILLSSPAACGSQINAERDQTYSHQMEQLKRFSQKHNRQDCPEDRHQMDEQPCPVWSQFDDSLIPEDICQYRWKNAYVQHAS